MLLYIHLQLAYKENMAVVLFSNKAEAQACAREFDGKALSGALKVNTA